MEFKIFSDYKPTGDQPKAIKELTQGITQGYDFQTLLGVTGSGKTFTMANVIENVKKPTLILSHNKTLAAQLYGEFKSFFPKNAVEYFVSYYDYYQPEAYLPVTDTYIEKDLSINDEISKLRLAATTALLSGRTDVIVVASVSCIYGIGNPKDFKENIITIKEGDLISRNKFLLQLVQSLYARNDKEFIHGVFRVKGDVIDIFPGYADIAYKVYFFGDEIEKIYSFNPLTGKTIESLSNVNIYPASIFNTNQDSLKIALEDIQDDMQLQVEYFKNKGMNLEAKRIKDRVTYDVEMMRELGYCSGIENYSRYFDRREEGSRPFCLLDYFPEDYLLIIDESHVTLPQVRAMYGGDKSRKENLVEYGFRLPSAKDNRPLKYEEFERLINQAVFVSATPADYEITLSQGVIVEQIIRPTGLLDPVIEIRPTLNQIDDLMEEIKIRANKDERVIVTTLTKKMAEELDKYLDNKGVRCRYIHSEVDTLDRVEIISDLKKGLFDVIIGVNLLREGIDLPEVSLVVILDADKEGFLRSERALIQTVGRAARNIEGRVIFYADNTTVSMQKTMDSTSDRRKKQEDYNKINKIKPTPIRRLNIQAPLSSRVEKELIEESYSIELAEEIKSDPVIKQMSRVELINLLIATEKRIKKASQQENYLHAAKLRDQIIAIKEVIISMPKVE